MKKILISIFFLLGAIQANSADWKSFGLGEERKYLGNHFLIEYPPDFTFSPESRIFPVGYKGERRKAKIDIEGDFLMLESRQRKFSIIVFNFVPDLGNSDGSPMDVDETIAFQKSRLNFPKVEHRKSCTVVHGITRNGLHYIAHFIPNRESSGGAVFSQALFFTSPTPMKQVDPVIIEVISRFKSCYDIYGPPQ